MIFNTIFLKYQHIILLFYLNITLGLFDDPGTLCDGADTGNKGNHVAIEGELKAKILGFWSCSLNFSDIPKLAN